MGLSMRIRMSALRWATVIVSAAFATAVAGQDVELRVYGPGGMSYTPASSRAADRERNSTRSILRNLLLSGSGNKYPGQVAAFYAERQFQPAWSDSASEQRSARDVRAVLARAHEQGLRDEDYQLPGGDYLARGEDAAFYEIAVTDALLR